MTAHQYMQLAESLGTMVTLIGALTLPMVIHTLRNRK